MAPIRLWLLAGSLSIFCGAVAWMNFQRGGASGPPPWELEQISFELGRWQGADEPVTDETVQVLGAFSHINRIYRDSLGREIALHSAVWVNKDAMSAAPHHPQVCYPAAGWDILDRKTIKLRTGGAETPVELIRFQREEESVITAHWYRVGDVAFTDDDGFQLQRLKFVGTAPWPSSMKVLMQVRQGSIESAEPLLSSFCQNLLDELRRIEESRSPRGVTNGSDKIAAKVPE